MSERVKRADAIPIGKVTKTPQGFLRVDAACTRTGVLVYHRADGSVFRELRHPDEVFKAESLATLAGAPVTDMHPAEFVGPDNVRNLQRGFVGSDVRADDAKSHVVATVVVQDGDMIQAIGDGKRKELSPGYTCRIDNTPGEYNGESYDGKQIDIVYNHLAIGPKGWGRSGPSVALRTDAHNPLTADDGTVMHFDSWPDNSAGRTNSQETKDQNPMAIKTVRIDGADVSVDDAHAEKVTAAAAKLETLAGERDALKKRVDELTAKLDAANDPVRISKLVSERVSLVAAATKVIGAEIKTDGKTDRELMIDAIVKASPEFKADGKSDEYIRARFDSVVEFAVRAPAADPLAAFRAGSDEGQRTDGGAEDPVAKARAAATKRVQDAWKKPFVASADK